MIKTLEKSRFVQDINRTKPFTMYPFCLTDLNLFARQSDTRNKKNSFVAFVRSFVRKCIYIYVDTNYSFEQTIRFKLSDRESYSGSSTRRSVFRNESKKKLHATHDRNNFTLFIRCTMASTCPLLLFSFSISRSSC